MSADTAHSTAALVVNAAVDACWRQWRIVGFPASATADGEPTALIDPEALVLLSLSMAPRERRLEDALAWWAVTGARLLSVQRTTSLLRRFPESTRAALGALARMAHDAGDRRWSAHSGPGDLAAGRRAKGPEAPVLGRAPALMLRLRAGFGVGVKTDLLAFLLGRGDRGATIKEAQAALVYTAPALRTAAAEMALASLLKTVQDRPLRYVALTPPWEAFVGMIRPPATAAPNRTGDLPPWRDWSRLFAFLAHAVTWMEQARADQASPYVLSSRARDLVIPLLPVFTLNGIPVPDPGDYKGEAYIAGFEDTLSALSDWLATQL